MPASFRWRDAFERGLDLCAFLFLPILVLASRGAAPLFAVAGLCGLGLAAPCGNAAWRRVRSLAPIFAALVAWALLSSLWAIDPARSLVLGLRLAALFAGGLALIAAAPEIAASDRLLRWLAAGFAVALLLGAVQAATSGQLTVAFRQRPFIGAVLNQAEDGFAFLLLPLCAALLLRERRFLAAAFAVVTLAMIFWLVGETARAGFVAGVIAALLLYRWRRSLTRAAAAASVALVLCAPLVLPPLGGIAAVRDATLHLKNSAWHRLEIWAFVGDRIADKPLLGWGLDASRAIPGGDEPIANGYPGQKKLPLHPHNAALQVWLELGLPGALLFSLLIARVWWALGAATWRPLYAAAAGGSLTAALIVALGSYGVWQEWLIATEFLTLFLILVLERTAARPTPETVPAGSHS
jgi:O-antigen ligase